jgi:hypothetical protein
MKRIRLRRVAPLLAAALGAAACNDNLTDINVNPNRPITAPAPYVLSSGQNNAVRRALGTDFHMNLTALWAQQFAKIQYINEDRYDIRPGTVTAHWSGFYTGPLADFNEVMRQGVEQERPNYTAIGDIMSVWTWHQVTDVWGDIPYSEALKGSIADGNEVTPVYDTQQSIYVSLLSRLATSQAALDAGGTSFGDADLIYGGDVAMWRRFANSLRLRLAMRLAGRDPTGARATFEAAAALPLITTNAQNADLDFAAGQADANPIFVNQQTRDDHAISRTMVDSLKGLADPRLRVYANPAPMFRDSVTALGGGIVPFRFYQGMENGIAAGSDNNLPARSRIGSFFTSATAPAVLMSAAEVQFLLAEAKLRGWNVAPGMTADQLYAEGIRLSMEQYGLASEAAAYVAQPGVSIAGPSLAEQLRRVALQKWIALYGNGPEAYAEWRRTGVPGLTVASGTTNGNHIPVRVFYADIEASLNRENRDAAVARNGGADLNVPVWWDN